MFFVVHCDLYSHKVHVLSSLCVCICDVMCPSRRDEMLTLLPQLKSAVTSQLRASNALSECEISSERYRHQIMYLEEAKDDGLHPLYTLAHRYSEYKVVRETKQAIQRQIETKLADCERWYTAHRAALGTL